VIEPENESGKGGYGKGTTRKLPYAERYKTSKTTKTKTTKTKTAKTIASEGACPASGELCAIGEGTCKCHCYAGPGGKGGKGADFEDLLVYGAKL
jgi:hypothetical protein